MALSPAPGPMYANAELGAANNTAHRHQAKLALLALESTSPPRALRTRAS
jgi:hypothetical protein